MGQQYDDPFCDAVALKNIISVEYYKLTTPNYDLSAYESFSYNEETYNLLNVFKDFLDGVSTPTLGWCEGVYDLIAEEYETSEDFDIRVWLIFLILLMIMRYLMVL